MTYIDLVRSLLRSAQVTTDGIDTLQGAPEEIQLLAQVVRQAEQSIVAEYADWRFVVGVALITPAAGSYIVDSNAPGWPTDLGGWDAHGFFLNPNTVNSQPLGYISYTDWRNVTGQYYRASILPNDSIGLTFPTKDGDTLRGEYRVTFAPMLNDDDLSVIPEQYHQAIEGAALMGYAEIEGAPELYQRGRRLYEPMHKLMQAEQLEDQFQIARATNPAPTQVIVP